MVRRKERQESVQAVGAVRWEGDGTRNGINQPTQDKLLGRPGGVAFQKLLHRIWFFSVGTVGGGKGAKDSIDAFKKCAPGSVAVWGQYLGGLDKIVHENVNQVKGRQKGPCAADAGR